MIPLIHTTPEIQINLWSQKISVGDCRERGKDERRRSNRETAGMTSVFTTPLQRLSQGRGHRATLIKLYTSNICCLVYVNYTFKSCQNSKLILFLGPIPPAPPTMSYLVLRECYDVGELLAPANLVEQGLVADVLAWVAVQPALLRWRVHLGPDVVYTRDGWATGSGGRKQKFSV